MSRKGSRCNGAIKKRRAELYRMQEGICFWCHESVPEKKATIDELIPLSKGGTQRWDNVVMSCHDCNNKRGAAMAPYWAFYLVQAREAWTVRKAHHDRRTVTPRVPSEDRA